MAQKIRDRAGRDSRTGAQQSRPAGFFTSVFWPGACLLAAAGWWLFRENGPAQALALLTAIAGLLPLGPHFAGNLAFSLYGCLVGATLYILYDASGTRLARWLTGREPDGILRFAAAPLAYGTVSPALLGAAAAGLWYRPLLAAALAVLAAYAAPAVPGSVRRMTGIISGAWNGSSNFGKAGWIALAGTCFFFISAPEINPDSMQYHLSFPQQLLEAHGLPGTQVFWFWLIPLPAEFPHVFPLMAGSDTAIRVLFTLFALSGTFAVLRALPFRLEPALAAAGAFTALALHDSSWVATSCKNDLMAAAFGLAGGALLASRSGVRPGQALLGAILLGYCWTAKFVLGPLAFLLAGVALVYTPRKRLPAVSGFMAIGLFLPVIPWLFRGYLACGDPLFPAGTMFFPRWTGTPWRNPDLLVELMKFQEIRPRSLFLSDTGRALLILSPMFLAGLPAILRARAWEMLVSAAVLSAGIGLQFLLMPASSYAIFRFDYLAGTMLFLSGFSALCGSIPGEDGARPAGNRRGVAAAICSFGLLAGLSHTAWWHNASYQNFIRQSDYPSGRMSAPQYQKQGQFSWGLIMPDTEKAVKRLPPGSSIIEMGDSFSWGSPARLRNDTVGPHPIWGAVSESDSLDRLEVKFRQMNARLMLYNSEKPIWAMTACFPYAWTPRMIVLYWDYARRHLRRLACSNTDFPTYGTLWLFEMLPQRAQPAVVDFLPGAERALCLVKRTKTARDFPTSFALIDDLRRMAPGVRVYDSIRSNLKFLSGDLEGCYPELVKQIDSGFVHDLSLNQALVSASIMGRKKDAERLYQMALKWYPSRKADIDSLLKMPPEAVRKGQYLQ